MKEHTELAAALLPCLWDIEGGESPDCHSAGVYHSVFCPAYYRPAVAAALAEKDLTHQALQSRAAKQILDLEIERDQLKKRVADLEQQVRVLENPRVTDEDWHKLALMYKERVAELEAEAAEPISDVEFDRLCAKGAYANGLAAAKIEGIKRAREILVMSPLSISTGHIRLLNAEIAALEKP